MLPFAARADDHWQVSYSCAHSTSTSGNEETEWQAETDTPTDATPNDSAVADMGNTNGVYSASAKDIVTATLTWVDDDGNLVVPGPKCVIVQEQATAEYSSANSTDSLGNNPAASNGLGDAVQNLDNPTTTDPYSYPAYDRVSGLTASGWIGGAISHYSVHDGTSGTITLTRTLSASVTSSAAPPSDDSPSGTEAGADTNYAVSAYAITIDLSGVTPNPDSLHPAVLTGQQVTANFNWGGATGTANSYQWIVGGNAFKDYDTTAPNSTNSTQLVPLGSGDLTGPTPGTTTVAPLIFYDHTQENLTVSCTTSFTPTGGSALTLTPQSLPITVCKPTATWGIASGEVYLKNGITQFMGLPGATVYKDGQNWHDVTVAVTAPFTAGGDFCFAQLVTPSRKIYRNLPAGSTASSYYQISGEGVQALDAVFPYQSIGKCLNRNTLAYFRINYPA